MDHRQTETQSLSIGISSEGCGEGGGRREEGGGRREEGVDGVGGGGKG